ncbi:hypothetical protein [Aquimarina mytili]|uniref:Uncharacterized protein n=1 Tax=Aquimarina mytili TaxID=874423 RepID=A0A937A4M6_9FLAO|nr:hypothetical protein [Aquimarina mytili]MBL0684259.1 hypothetical protein [Aquimarina mytili]
MSWRAFNQEEKETVYDSKAKSVADVKSELGILLTKMLEEKENANLGKGFLISINATNQYMQINWVDEKCENFVGDWSYSLELYESSWNKKLKNSVIFDKRCENIVKAVAKTFMDSGYTFYCRTEFVSTYKVSV